MKNNNSNIKLILLFIIIFILVVCCYSSTKSSYNNEIVNENIDNNTSDAKFNPTELNLVSDKINSDGIKLASFNYINEHMNNNYINNSWQYKINDWKNGFIQTYPSNISKRFFYETSVCNNNLSSIYDENFIESDNLEQLIQDYSSFQDEFNKQNINNDLNIITFYNKSGDAKLIVPIPKKNKDYTTIKDFIDNAPSEQQIDFWKKTAYEIELFLQSNKKVYVSTHGLGVSYFHLRLCSKPKYYITKRFLK